MPIYDYECHDCGQVWEVIKAINNHRLQLCPECKCIGKKIITASGVYTGNQDATWVKTVLEVVDKEDRAPHTQEFLKSPTRKNYKRWMQKEGLRPLESREGTKPPPPDLTRVNRKTWENLQKRRRIEIG